MSETLRRRLTGAAVLSVGAFIASFFIPKPEDTAKAPEPEIRSTEVAIDDPRPIPPVNTSGSLGSVGEAPDAMLSGENGAEGGIEPAPEFDSPVGEPAARAAGPQPTPAAGNSATMTASTTAGAAKSPSTGSAAAKTSPPASVATATTTSAADRWFVQAGSYGDLGNAKQVEAQIKLLGLDAVVAPIAVNGRTLYRVRTGPYTNRAEAEKIRTRFSSENLPASVMQDAG